MKTVKGKTIFVGLSGGVDSAVSAALLKKAEAAVTGVFIKGWYPPGMPCTWADDRRDAMRVAAHLGIPFHTLDASAEYKKGVIDYLLSEYAAGRTPNPDVMCNREVKFGAFYEFARAHKADFIATGHYARISKPHESISRSHLEKGIDASKDQSYFLWAVPQEAIEHTLFPVGEFQKSKVRALAEQFQLPVAAKKDSQGICFLGSISVDEFLRAELSPESGKAIDESGEEVGTHDGAVLYTLGERIAVRNAAPGPWFVLKKDMRENVLTISHEIAHSTETECMSLRDTNWFEVAETDAVVEAQYRYHGPLIKGTLDQKAKTFTPTSSISEPIAKGQSLVLYDGDRCIGGGIIV
jgi:tRNA-specific 2-thiouridylase